MKLPLLGNENVLLKTLVLGVSYDEDYGFWVNVYLCVHFFVYDFEGGK